eukprot:161260-Chlamydomonas_euryale.AAC.3
MWVTQSGSGVPMAVCVAVGFFCFLFFFFNFFACLCQKASSVMRAMCVGEGGRGSGERVSMSCTQRSASSSPCALHQGAKSREACRHMRYGGCGGCGKCGKCGENRDGGPQSASPSLHVGAHRGAP